MIILAHTDVSPRNISEKMKDAGISEWVFLSRDYNKLCDFRKNIDFSKNINIGESLSKKSSDLRDPLNDFFSRMAEKYSGLEWFSTRISERNTLISDLFIHICYYAVLLDLLSSKKDICIISESRAIIRLIKKKFDDTREVHPQKAFIGAAKRSANKTILMIRTMFSVMSNFAATRKYCRKPKIDDIASSGKKVLLFTWINAESVISSGKVKDEYFRGLKGYLESKGSSVLVMPRIFNANGRYKDVYKILALDGGYIFEHLYYRITDYLFPLLVCLKRNFKRFDIKGLEVNGIDIKDIFAEHLRNERAGDSYENILLYRLAKRLNEEGTKLDIYIDFYETMLPQRMFRMGFRDNYKKLKLMTYQHAPFFPNLLCMYPLRGEEIFLPDRILCSSNEMIAVAEKIGYKSSNIFKVPALRYQHVFDGDRRVKRTDDIKKIAAIAPAEKKLAREFIEKVGLTLRDLSGVDVLVKMHPMTDLDDLNRFLGRRGIEMPEFFTFVREPVRNILKKCDLALIMSTSTILEAVAMDVPFVNIASELSLRHDPTEWFENLSKPIYSEKVIILKVQDALNDVNVYKYKKEKESIFEPDSDVLLEKAILC